nr:LPXTG cell wall anchor domain-containing protein [Clostridia bacterium]
LGGVTYRKSGGETASYTVTTDSSGNAMFNFGGTTVTGSVTTVSYKKIVDVEGGDPVEQDATAQVYAATYNGTTYYMPIATLSSAGDFEWDVSPLGTLENNATYTVSFVVWPDQDAYDYVTNLNNGITGYTWDYVNEVEVKTPSGSVAYYTDGVSQYPNIVRYPTTPATFAAMSNTYQTVDYYIAQTEEVDGVTTTTYVKGDPIALNIPDPMILTGTSFTVTKRWDDSLDQSQLAKLIADAAAHGETYSVTLNLTEDGAFYKSYTFEPVWNEDTEQYEWPSQTINIAPALLTTTNPGGTYKTVTIGGSTYYVLNEGHEYVLEETDLDSHFEFVTETYHPALVNGVLMNVSFQVNDNDEIIDGSTAEIVGTVPLTTFAGINTLKGGINIYKRVVDEENAIVDDDSTFKVQVTLDHINQEGLQIWFDTYEVDPATGEIVIPTEEQLTHWINTTTGEITETEPSGYKDKVQVIDAEKGIYKNANGVLYGVNGKTPVYANETNYIGPGGYGNVSGYTNVLDIQDNWMIRIVNVLAGTTYEVVETQTNGMQPSYEYWHDNAESDEHIVIGNAASNIRITNKIVNKKVIVYKTDMDESIALSGASFTILEDTTLTTDGTGYTAVIELPTSSTPYDLTETVAPVGYNRLTSPVEITVSSSGVAYQQADYSGGAPQTAEKDDDGNYVVIVHDSAGTALPNTGGSGNYLNYLGGVALLLTAAVMYGFRMRRRERRYN